MAVQTVPLTVRDTARVCTNSRFTVGSGLKVASRAHMSAHPAVSVAIVSPIAEEWRAACRKLEDPQSVAETLPTKVGRIAAHSVVCVQIGKGESKAAAALKEVLHLWTPRWVVLVGVAGGFPSMKVHRGDVVFATFVYDLDFGKLIDGRFVRRPEYDVPCDVSLLAYASNIAGEAQPHWASSISVSRPDGGPASSSTIHDGYVASSGKVVDDPSHSFYSTVVATLPEVHAVDMEGSGAGAAIRLEQSRRALGFLMVRGISDEPANGPHATEGTAQRKEWKAYACDAAAAFCKALLVQFPASADSVGQIVTEDQIIGEIERLYASSIEDFIQAIDTAGFPTGTIQTNGSARVVAFRFVKRCAGLTGGQRRVLFTALAQINPGSAIFRQMADNDKCVSAG